MEKEESEQSDLAIATLTGKTENQIPGKKSPERQKFREAREERHQGEKPVRSRANALEGY